MKISKKIEIDMGHRIPNHNSKCKNFHGHRYVFEAIVEGEPITREGDSSEGMVLDFSDIKKCMNRVIDSPLDHGFMIYSIDMYIPFFKNRQQEGMKVIIVNFIPTVENIAKWVFKKLNDELFSYNIKLSALRVWETPTSMAEVKREEFE